MSAFIGLVLWSLWFFLPAGVANATPVFVSRLPLLKDWNTSLDGGQVWRGKRMLGANKTWRGLVFGTLAAGLVGLGQSFIFFTAASRLEMVLIASLMGFGALIGDAAESFLKRRRDVPSGQSWFPFDQTDYIIGGLLFIYPFTKLPLAIMSIILVGYFGLHLLTVYIFFRLGVRDKPI